MAELIETRHVHVFEFTREETLHLGHLLQLSQKFSDKFLAEQLKIGSKKGIGIYRQMTEELFETFVSAVQESRPDAPQERPASPPPEEESESIQDDDEDDLGGLLDD